jgi:hypothetical protein
MKNTHRLCLLFLIVAGMGFRAQAAGAKAALIVMPVRYTVVQFAFDVARIRSVDLLAYDKGTGEEPLLLHRWDAQAKAWKPADIAAYQAGSLFAPKPSRVFLMGNDDDLPAELASASWCRDVTRIPSLKVVDMANTMSPKLKFSEREWNSLAKRHNLKLTDDNAELRRYGRYGKPGTVYQGERPVNPLIARFRRAKPVPQDVPQEAEAEEVLEGVEAAPEPTAEAESDLTEPNWIQAEKEGVSQAVEAVTPMAGDESEEPEPDGGEGDTAAEDK